MKKQSLINGKPQVTWGETFRYTWRGAKLLQKLTPHFWQIELTTIVIQAVTPFINIYMTALILDELVGAHEIARLAFLVCTTILLNTAVSVAQQALMHQVQVNEIYKNYDNRFMKSQRILTADYADVENPAFHLKKQHIDDIENYNSCGLLYCSWQIDAVVRDILILSFSIGMALPAFLRTDPAGGFLISPWASLGLIVLLVGTGILRSWFNRITSSRMTVMMDERSLKLNRLANYYTDHYLQDYRTGKDVRVYREQSIINHTTHRMLDIFEEIQKKRGALSSRYASLDQLFAVLTNGAAYLLVGLKALYGLFSIGEVTMYVGALGQFMENFSHMIYSFFNLRVNAFYLRDVFEFLDTPRKMYQGTLPVEKRRDNEYVIEFRNVSFRYPGAQEYALRNVSIQFRVGERLAVVGMNGSGKTTFIKLLSRLYDPTEGEILLNGIDIRKYDYDEYQSVFSIVFQDFNLFAFSVGQNVAASMEYDEDRVLRCLDEAGAGERVRRMSCGVHTPLYKNFDEEGVEISGGEAQKIALARALYKDAPFIVLDEPTAALDPISEYEIYSRFNEIVGSKTAIYISHRLSSCRFCESILVFHEGQIVQRGSHEQLLADCDGKYSALWNAQAQYYVDHPGQKSEE